MGRDKRTSKVAARLTVVLAVTTFLLGVPSRAAAQAPRLPETVAPVTVTDGAGRAITGLGQQMFRVEVDGDPTQMASFSTSEDIAASIVFAPSVVKRWRKIRESAAEAVRESTSAGRVTLVLASDEPRAEVASDEAVQFSQPKDRYRCRGGEFAGMIALGLESMQAIPSRKGLRQAVFVVLASPAEDLRYYRKSLVAQAAADDVQVFALWRSQRR